jgi:hypothetical protein
MTRPTYYDILGVDRAASPAEITRKYNEAVRRIDAASTHSSVFAELVSEAYGVLHDQSKRRWYDATTVRAQSGDLATPATPLTEVSRSASVSDTVASNSAVASIADRDAPGRSTATSHGTPADPWLVIGWWAYGCAIGVLLAVAASITTVNSTMDGDEMISSNDLGYLVLVGATGAIAALVGALCRTDTLRLQLGSSVLAIGFWGSLLVVAAITDRAPWFFLGAIYVSLLVVGSFIIAWRRHHARTTAPGWVPYTPRVARKHN